MEELLFEAYPDIMTVLQVSEALHIGRNSAYNLINSNSIRHPSHRIVHSGAKNLPCGVCGLRVVHSEETWQSRLL